LINSRVILSGDGALPLDFNKPDIFDADQFVRGVPTAEVIDAGIRGLLRSVSVLSPCCLSPRRDFDAANTRKIISQPASVFLISMAGPRGV
jgi:hypothetical protein